MPRHLPPPPSGTRVVRRLLVCVGVCVCTAAPVRSGPTGELEPINEVLRRWIRVIDAGRPHLVFDGSMREVRLQHGAAVLRQCPVLSSALGAAVTDAIPYQTLSARLRRYRRADPFHEVEAGPFDWEHYLVSEATDVAGLLFSEGLLLYAADVWEPLRPPSIRLRPTDLRALYDALADSVEIVVLPAGWEEQER